MIKAAYITNILGIITGIIGVILSLFPLFALTPNSTFVRNYPYDIFLFLSGFSPALILLLIACLPVSLFLKEFMVGILKFKNRKIHQLPSGYNSIKSRSIIFYLLLSMLLSVA